MLGFYVIFFALLQMSTIFQQPDSQALFVNNLLRGVMHVTRDVEAVHMSSEIIQRALTHSSVAVLSLLPNNGDV